MTPAYESILRASSAETCSTTLHDALAEVCTLELDHIVTKVRVLQVLQHAQLYCNLSQIRYAAQARNPAAAQCTAASLDKVTSLAKEQHFKIILAGFEGAFC